MHGRWVWDDFGTNGAWTYGPHPHLAVMAQTPPQLDDRLDALEDLIQELRAQFETIRDRVVERPSWGMASTRAGRRSPQTTGQDLAFMPGSCQTGW